MTGVQTCALPILYDRLGVLRSCISKDGPVDRLDHHFLNEINFLEDVLDVIERS